MSLGRPIVENAWLLWAPTGVFKDTGLYSPVKSWDPKILALGLVASQSGVEATIHLASRQSWRAIPGLRLAGLSESQ